MLAWIIQITIISFIFIFLVHHLIQFLKNTLTVPKIKDLVNNPSKKYDSIYEIISNVRDFNEKPNMIGHGNGHNLVNTTSSTDINLLPIVNEKDEMKNELKNFLKNQLNINTVEGENNNTDSVSFYQFK